MYGLGMMAKARLKDHPEHKRTDGTQAISRAVQILRLMARRGSDGSRLTELSKISGIPHPTLRRILVCLIDEGFVIQNPETRKYLLGPLNFELGLAVTHRSDMYDDLKPLLERIARASGDTVYLNMRSGFDQVCLLRIEGYAPIRAVIQDVGGRRPLCFGSSGLAIMASLDDSEIERILQANANDIANHGWLTREAVRRAVTKARQNGFAVIRDTSVLGVSAIGMMLPPQPRKPAMGVAVAMVNERLTYARARELYKILKQEIQRGAASGAAA
jgi:DNA-binding IclR family transcriptional regulator